MHEVEHHDHPPPAAPAVITGEYAYSARHEPALIHRPHEWAIALASVLHHVVSAEVHAHVDGARVGFRVDCNDASQVQSVVADVSNAYFAQALGNAAHAIVSVTDPPVAVVHSHQLGSVV